MEIRKAENGYILKYWGKDETGNFKIKEVIERTPEEMGFSVVKLLKELYKNEK